MQIHVEGSMVPAFSRKLKIQTYIHCVFFPSARGTSNPEHGCCNVLIDPRWWNDDWKRRWRNMQHNTDVTFVWIFESCQWSVRPWNYRGGVSMRTRVAFPQPRAETIKPPILSSLLSRLCILLQVHSTIFSQPPEHSASPAPLTGQPDKLNGFLFALLHNGVNSKIKFLFPFDLRH